MSLLTLMGNSTATTPAPPTGGDCAYPLSYAPLAAYGFQEPAMSNGDQTMTVALTESSNFGAISYPATIDASTGTKVVRLAIDTMTAVAVDGSEGDFKIELGFLDAGLSPAIAINIQSVNGFFRAYVSGGPGIGGYVGSDFITPPAYMDIRFRSADSKFDATLPDGTVVGNFDYTPQPFNPLMTVVGAVSGDAVGAIQAARFVADATTLANSPFLIAGPFTDACGNAT